VIVELEVRDEKDVTVFIRGRENGGGKAGRTEMKARSDCSCSRAGKRPQASTVSRPPKKKRRI
jgi:hypothetical protein